MRILLTGATGYLGGRLLPRLVEAGHEVTALVRDPSVLQGREWSDRIQAISGDCLETEGTWTTRVAEGRFDAAYYLVHSLGAGHDFQERDRRAAANFGQAARTIPHVIYLGGLQPEGPNVSDHLRSRAETGEVLRQYVRLTEFRAGPVVGSGSASFEMIRYLTERIPLMTVPLKINNPVQPIGVRSVLNYLQDALEIEPAGIVDIGAPAVTFRQMIEQYAELRGFRRFIVPVPFLSPTVASRWVGLVTPLTASVARPLIEGVSAPLRADTRRAEKLFPHIRPSPYQEAVRRALDRIDSHQVETRWTGASPEKAGYRLEDWEGMICEDRIIDVEAPPEAVYRAFTSLGGEVGWLVWTWAWTIRGWLDQLVGGPGLRRGRRDPEILYPGEVVDFWRVERVETNREILLRAEMKVPGRAWLGWRVEPLENGSRLRQRALFRPKGLGGVLYWYALFPIHRYIFDDLIQAVATRARAPRREPFPQSV